MADSKQIYYRTITNLVHPAVLGTIIVNLIDSNLTGTFFQLGLFPIYASVVLVWYFVLDYWVTMISFEENPSEYGFNHFLLDIVTLVVLFSAFYFLWSKQNDTGFFASLTVLIILIIVWSYLVTGLFGLSDPISKVQIVVFICCVIPLVSSLWFSDSKLVHSILKYLSLSIVSVALIFYTKFTLTE